MDFQLNKNTLITKQLRIEQLKEEDTFNTSFT